jgi:hypothetical protein
MFPAWVSDPTQLGKAELLCIHVLVAAESKTWMAGTSPAMTMREQFINR